MITNENTPTIETERLILRKFTEHDADALFELLSDKDINTFLPWFPLKNINEANQFLQERFLAYYHKPSSYRYAICLKKTTSLSAMFGFLILRAMILAMR